MKSLTLLWSNMLKELGMWCDTSTNLDLRTVKARSKHEGLSFLTITLTNFGRDFERSLDLGYVDRKLFQGFSWQSGLPRFLGGFLDLIFDRGTGRLLDCPSIDAIYAVRQLTLMFGKINIDCSKERIDAAIDGYVKCDEEVAGFSCDSVDEDQFCRISTLLFGSMFSAIDSDIFNGLHIPKHGPGATSERIRSNQKYIFKTWPKRLESYFPSSDFAIPNYSYWEYLQESVTSLEPGSEIPVRVITVPKTLKTPRIIAIEPVSMQYAQQSLLECILYHHRSHEFGPFVGFDDQHVNRDLARKGSDDGSLATLDLSEASDRVSVRHVDLLLSHYSHLHQAVLDCRSSKADVPGHGIITLSKFASMGSALCFPIEAFVFTTLAFCGIEKSLNLQLTRKSIKTFLGNVRVYGDDIIVPVEHVSSVVECLESFGFRVNSNKSFWTGSFRESCGGDYYDGHDVTVTRVRTLIPSQRTDVAELVSTVSLRNLLYKRGLWRSASYLDSLLQDILHKYPNVGENSPALGRYSFLGYTVDRISQDTQSPEVRAFVVSPVIPSDPLDDMHALLKFFLKRGSTPLASGHLERSGRPSVVRITQRWVPPF